MFETTFSVTEAALVRTYGVPHKAQGAFRGKLGNLQKQGLFGAKNMPGRGKALRYRPDQFHRLIFACELFEFGVGPATVLALVELLWESRLSQIFKKAEDAVERHRDPGPDDIVMHMGGVRLMTDTWSDAVPNVNYCTLQKLNDHMQVWMWMGVDDRLPSRALVVNLSSRLRQFHAAFRDLHMQHMPEKKDKKRRKK